MITQSEFTGITLSKSDSFELAGDIVGEQSIGIGDVGGVGLCTSTGLTIITGTAGVATLVNLKEFEFISIGGSRKPEL